MSNINLEKFSSVMLLASTRWDVDHTNPLGVLGTIIGKGLGLICVKWDNQNRNDYMGDDSDLVKVVEVKDNGNLCKDDKVMMLANIGYGYPLGVIGNVVDVKENEMRVEWDKGFVSSYLKKHNNLVRVA
jgi:hypothetical protein